MAAFPQTIAGLPAKQVRDLLDFCGHSFRAPRAVRKLRRPLKEALDLLLALEKEGYVERLSVDSSGDIAWQRSMVGQRLVCTRFGQRLKRATAERILAAVVDRAKALNQQTDRVQYFSRLCVFGSYLSPEVETLGDVDIGYSLSRRPAADGADYRLFDPWNTECVRFVRGRSGYVAMNPVSVIEALKTQTQVRVRELLTASDAEVPPFERPQAGSVLDW